MHVPDVNLERREAPRPVIVASAFVQMLGGGKAQTICAMCGQVDVAPDLRIARAFIDLHLEEEHRGWVLYAGPGREHAVANRLVQ